MTAAAAIACSVIIALIIASLIPNVNNKLAFICFSFYPVSPEPAAGRFWGYALYGCFRFRAVLWGWGGAFLLLPTESLP
jgi:hypothetical protein